MESSFAIVAEPNRRAILSLLLSSERSVGEIERELRLSQPSVSKHLRVLREAGFVESRIEAQRRLYRLRPEPLMELDAWLVPFRRFWSKHVDALEQHLDKMDKVPPSEDLQRRKEGRDMSSREQYAPGAASGAEVQKDGEKWTLVLVRDLAHPPAKVWKALTDPEHLREWAPFDSDRNLGAVGTAKLTTVGAPTPLVSETQVKRADAPKVLEFNWGGQDIRWELEPLGGGGTRLTLWHNIDRRFISMGAAGWHICFDVLERLLAGQPIGRMVGPEAMKFGGWQRLNAEYAKQFGVELPSWSAGPS